MWSDLAKGYAIQDMGFGNFKLPLLFVVMLLPIIFQGPGKISLDYLLARQLKADPMPEPLVGSTPTRNGRSPYFGTTASCS